MSLSKPFIADLAPNTVHQFVDEGVLALLNANPDLVRHLEAKGAAEKGKKRASDRHYDDGAQVMANMLARTRLEDGGRAIAYAYGKNRKAGQLYAKTKGSLQTAPTYTRHALTHGILRDWDMANAFFAICRDVCRMINIPCPMINDYCDNREATLEGVCTRLSVRRGEAKSLLLATLNGLTNFSRQELQGDTWLHRFADECERVQECFVRAYPEVAAKKKGKPNVRGKVTGDVLGGFMAGILKVMVETIQGLGLEASVYMLDGLMTHGDVPEGLAETLTAAIHKRTDFTSVSVIEKEIPLVDLHAEAAAAGITLVDPAAQDAVEDEGEYMDRDALIKKIGAAIYVILDAGMGSGKTEACVELVKHLRGLGWTVMWVTMRCSQVDSIGDRLTSAWAAMPAEVPPPPVHARGTVPNFFPPAAPVAPPAAAGGRPVDFAKYNQEKNFGGCRGGLITPEEFPHVIVEWESIHLAHGYYDLIICDEKRSTIATVNSSTNGVNGSHRQFHLDRFDDLMRHCRMFVAMDADCGVDGAVDDVISHFALDRAKKEALDALRDANEAEGEAREVALQRAMAMQRIADSGDVSSLVYKVIRKTQKITRDVVQMPDLSAIDRALDMASEGKRLGILCLGKARAKDLKRLLEKRVKGTIGLYHSGSPDLGDVRHINEAWDKHQIIIFTSCITAGPSYEGEMDAVFLFPCIGVTTPRGAHQMCGRFRNVKSNTVFLGVSGVAEEDVEGVTRHGLDEAFKLELLRLRYGNKAFATFTDEVKDQLAASGCVHPGMVQRKTFSSPPLLQKIIAYDLVERSYTQTSGKWLSYFKYMANLKGYSWRVNDKELSEVASIKLKIDIKDAARARKDAREAGIAEVVVEPFTQDPEYYDRLQKVAAGCNVKGGREAFMRDLEDHCGITVNNLEDAAAKVRIARDMPDTDPAKITACVIDAVARSSTAITCHRILAASGGDGGCGVAALLQDTYERYTQQGSETLRVTPHHTIALCDRLMKAMRLEGVGDRETPVNEGEFNKAEVELALKDMAAVRMCRNTTCNIKAVKGVLQRAMGYNVFENQPVCLTGPVEKALKLYPPLDMEQWFEGRNPGAVAVSIGEFTPSTTDSTRRLEELKGLFAVQAEPAGDDPFAHAKDEVRDESTRTRWCKRRAVVNEVMREQDVSDSEFIEAPMEWEMPEAKKIRVN